MRAQGRIAAAIALAAFAMTAAPAAAYTPPLVIPWETLLPALPTHANPQFTGTPGCETAKPACIDGEISRMDALRVQLGCDHRAVFATTYELLTEQLKQALDNGTAGFADPKWVIGEDGVFANLYFGWVQRYDQGRSVPGAWQVAFDSAGSGDLTGLQDMLLGINAHVQRDMPFMLATVGLRAPNGTSHKPDHDRFNAILNDAYAPVVDAIAARFDPTTNLVAPGFNPLLGLGANVVADQLVQAWREGVWRNAERLLNARTPAARRRVDATIEANATATAVAIAAFRFPGWRTVRAGYCAAHNSGPLTLG